MAARKSCSRRSLFQVGLLALTSAWVAACAPAKALPSARTVTAGPDPQQQRPNTTGGPSGTATPLPLTTPTVRAIPAPASPTPQRVARLSSRSIDALGRSYRAYPEVAGTVQFENSWDGARIPIVEGWIADMGAIYPSVTVQNDVGDAASMRERLVTALASGLPPNAVMLGSESLAYFVHQDALLPLTGLMDRDGIDGHWFTRDALRSCTLGGQVYGLPQTAGGADHLLYVNLRLLDQIGVDRRAPLRTWHDLEQLVEPARDAGLLVLDPGRIGGSATAHQIWTYANGGQYWDDGLQTIRWTEPASVEAAEWLRQFVRSQAPNAAGSPAWTAAGSALAVEEWAAERAICTINDAGWLYELQQYGQPVEFAVYPFPRNPTNPNSQGATPSTGGWMIAMPRHSRDLDVAWEWLKLTSASASACTFAEIQRRPSPLAGCDEHQYLARTHPFWPALRESAARTVTIPTMPMQSHLEAIYRTMQDDIMSERLPGAEALTDSAREAQRLLDTRNTR